jgi:hypothetical protein
MVEARRKVCKADRVVKEVRMELRGPAAIGRRALVVRQEEVRPEYDFRSDLERYVRTGRV